MTITPISKQTLEDIREKNTGVDQRLTELEKQKSELQNHSEVLDSVREALGIDANASVVDAVQTLEEYAQELENELRYYQQRELEHIRQDISHSSDYTMSDLKDKNMDELEIIQESMYRIRGVQ